MPKELYPGDSLGTTGSTTTANEGKPVSAANTAQQTILPPGARPLRLVVPAFWDLTPQYDQHWQNLKRAGSVVDVTVIPRFLASFC